MSSEANPAGEQTRYGYDPAGNRTSEARPKGHVDGAGRDPPVIRFEGPEQAGTPDTQACNLTVGLLGVVFLGFSSATVSRERRH